MLTHHLHANGYFAFTALCQPGTYSESGLEPCDNCPSLHYQLNSGSTRCQPCTDTIATIDSCLASSSTDTVVNSKIKHCSTVLT